MFNWHEKKNKHKKNYPPSPQKFNRPSLGMKLVARQWYISQVLREGYANAVFQEPFSAYPNIGGPIQCVVSYRDQCARKHTS